MFEISINKLSRWLEVSGKKIGLDLNYFIKNGFWMLLHQTGDSIIGLIFFTVFARLASRDTFGSYQLVMAIFAVVSVVSIPGLNNAIIREVARGYEGEYVPAVRKSFFWSLIGMPIIVIIGLYYYLFMSHNLGIILMATSIFFPFFYAPNTWNAFLQGKNQYKRFTLFNLGQSFIATIFTLGVLFFKGDDALLLIAVYLSVYSLFNIFYFFKTLEYRENNRSSGEALSYGWFLTKINFFNYAAENVDKIIIGSLLSPISLAIFSVISALPFKIRMVIKALLSILFPKMAQESFRISDFLKRRGGRIAFIAALLLFFPAGCLYFFSIVPVSRLLFGDNYSEYYYYGQYFTLMVVTYVPLVFVTLYVQAKKMSQSIAIINIVSFLIKVISLVIGVKIWGLVGAIWMYNLNILLLLLMYLVAIYWEEKENFTQPQTEA